MRAVLAVVLVAGVAAGCQRNRPIEQLSFTELQALTEEVERRCAQQGYPRNHAMWRDCMMQEARKEEADRSERRAALRRLADSMPRQTVCNRTFTGVECTSF